MPENMNTIRRNGESEGETEIREDTRREQQELGAKILTQVRFEGKHKEIVDSTYEKALQNHEKLSGKNSQRRNMAYVARLERMVEKHGNELERKLWDASADKLVIRRDDIEDSYWKSQEQILRDDGQGRELGEDEKEMLTEEIQEQQWESLQGWANYLGDKNAPYPMWFKVYAWDGMSKMGVFDKKKGEFKKRNEHTVAPYPKLNAAVLGKVYEAIGGEGVTEEDAEEQEKLQKLVDSGNFNKLYSHFLLDQKEIIKTPERTEDVHGEWVEYLPGEEEALAKAAEGTPWCVASPAVGRNYLEMGRYGDEEEIDDEWYNESGDEEDENRAKFILFHLADPDSGELTENAVASIRLGTDGRVAEISGLNDGQALEDALVPIVEEKVKTLEGGEDFLEAFADKNRLMELDRRMQRNGEFTQDDYKFIFEEERPIKTLDTYNDQDPRLRELRLHAMLTNPSWVRDEDKKAVLEEAYWSVGVVPSLIGLGISPELIFDSKKGCCRAEDLAVYYENGLTDLDVLARKSYVPDVLAHYDEMMDKGIDATYLINHARERMDKEFSDVTPEMLEDWKAKGVELDVMVPYIYASEIGERLEELLEAGVSTDAVLKNIVQDDKLILKNAEVLLAYGAEPMDLVNVFAVGNSDRERVRKGLKERGLIED